MSLGRAGREWSWEAGVDKPGGTGGGEGPCGRPRKA